MKKLILCCVVVPVLAMCAQTEKKATSGGSRLAGTAGRPVPKTAPNPNAEPLRVPKDAVQLDSSTWRHTGKDGKTWIYRQTPFGLSRGPETVPLAQSSGATKPEVKVTDLGESYRFELPMPMGPQAWTRKKAELTEQEKGYVETATAKTQAAPVTAEKK